MSSNANHAFDRFEKIVLLSSIVTKARVPKTVSELNRVGITDFSTYIDTPSPFLDRLYLGNSRIFAPWCKKNISAIRVSFAHYKAIASAYYDGLSSILVFEDDVRFLKDVSAINEAIASLPDGFTIALFDHNTGSDESAALYEHYFPAPSNRHHLHHEWKPLAFHVNAATAYALSRQGMKTLLGFYDVPPAKIHHIDFYQSPKFYPRQTSFLYSPPIAIQDISTNTPTNSTPDNLSIYHATRQKIFGNLSDYNLS